MKKRILILSVFIASASIILFSCNKDKAKSANENKDTDEIVASSQKEAIAQMTFENVDQIADEVYSNLSTSNKSSQNSNSLLGPCATKSLDTISVPHILTINFGNTNCLCNDGKNRRGEIIISFMGHYRDSGSVHSTSFNNFYVNDNHVLGTRTRVNNGRNSSGHYTVTSTINSTIIFNTSGDTLIWNANHTKEWLHGYLSPNFIDDTYLITGNSNGNKLNGVTYNKTILIPLKRVYSCFYFVSGSVQIVKTNKPTKVIDYGNGNCNPWATVTVNGVTHTIHL
ncbi:MAG: hypothetical protein ACOYO1_11090 [Bacteroidales bacterium]